MRELSEKRGTAVLFITHDLGVVAELCRRVAVMYAGEVVETGPTAEVLRSPAILTPGPFCTPCRIWRTLKSP